MGDAATNWIRDTDEETVAPRRSGLLLAAASVPWLVVIALLAVPGRLGTVNGPTPPDSPATPDTTDPVTVGAGGGEPSPGDEAGEVAAGEPADPPTPGMAPAAEGGLWLAEERGRWRAEPGPEEAAALAVAVARGWLTGIGPRLAVEGVVVETPGRYAEHLVVEAMDQPSPEAAVVTLLAVVLEGGEELEARVRRLAVPLAWDTDGPRPAGSPWWLPGPSLEPLVPITEPVAGDHELAAARDAIGAAGFEDVEVHGLATTSGWPVVAHVTARTPDGQRLEGPVWLRRHLDGYVVAGTTLSGSGGGPEASSDSDPEREADAGGASEPGGEPDAGGETEYEP